MTPHIVENWARVSLVLSDFGFCAQFLRNLHKTATLFHVPGQLDPHQSPVTSPPPGPRRASRSTRPSKSCHKVRPSPPLTAAAAPAQMLVHSSSLTRPGHSTALENRWNRCPVNKAEMGRFGEGMMKLHQMPINMQCEIFSTKSFWLKSYLNHVKLLFIRTILAYRASSHISYHMPYQQREVEMLISGSRTLCLVKIGQF